MEQMKDIRIPVTVGNVTFKNPFYVASGPTAKSVRQLLRIEETGWAAASIKLSIDPAPYINRKPRYSLFEDRNALAFTAEKRLTFKEGLKLIRDAKPLLHDLKLMANITYAGERGTAGWVNMAKKFEEAGADIIELNMCCPNMSYNLEITSGGNKSAEKQTGASMGQHADIASEIVRAVKKELHIPLFVKLTPEGGQIAKIAEALYAAGADAVGGTGNRLGMPPIDLDNPGKAFYHLQEEISMGCHSGKWLKPLSQRDTYEIRKVCGNEVCITAAGGITDWRDAVEMVLCGSNLLGICTETLISGYDIVRPMTAGMDAYMKSHGYDDLRQFCGRIVPEVKTALDVTIHDGYARIKEPNLAAPCKSACPHHVPVQAYVQKIAKRDYRAAYDLITERNALQNICALVCNHPCEDACIRGTFDSPVKIKALKRFVLEYGRAQGWIPKWAAEKANGHKIAVVGAGPAGLACASELRKAGYSVTVFEKETAAGGNLRYGIPEYEMNRQLLDEEIDRLKQAGICFSFGRALGRDFTVEELLCGYERVFIGIGAGKYRKKHFKGAENTVDALEWLRSVNSGEICKAPEQVAVIGSGFAALDAARCAVRLGGKEVVLLYTGSFPKQSGAYEELLSAQEEGVAVLDCVQVEKAENGVVMFTRGDIGLSLNAALVLTENVRIAETELVGADSRNGFISVNNCETTVNGVYAGGDAVRCANVISAIAAGKNAACAIDRSVRGEYAVLKPIPMTKTVNIETVRKRIGYLKKDNNPIKLDRKAEERKYDFSAYTRVMTEEEAVREASRCLNCGCGEGCQLCKTICAEFAPEITEQDTVYIRRENCVACGMCFNRCPNGNIEMVDLGETV